MRQYTVTFEIRTLQNTIRIQHVQVLAVNSTQAIRKAEYEIGATHSKVVYVR